MEGWRAQLSQRRAPPELEGKGGEGTDCSEFRAERGGGCGGAVGELFRVPRRGDAANGAGWEASEA